MPKFSVIIPVRNINDFLKENISYLQKINYSEFEVLIITDSMEEYDFGGSSKFRIIESGPKGPGEKRNIGAKYSTGDILVFLDDDAYPTPDWLINAAKVFEDPEVYALGAPAVTPINASMLEKASGRVLESTLASGGTTYRYIPSKRRDINDYPTVNLFIRKTAFESVGGFPIDFWPGEDTKICLDLIKKYGRNFLYDPTPVVYHHRRKLFLPHLKQISRYGSHRGQFARIFPGNSRVPSYFVPSLFVLGIFLGPVFGSIYSPLWLFYWFVLGLYFYLVTVEAFKAYLKDKDILESLCVALGIFFTHMIYGISFIYGILRRPKLVLRGVDSTTGNYLGG